MPASKVCRLVVIDAQFLMALSMPTGMPNLKCSESEVKKKTLFSAKQLSWDTAPLWKQHGYQAAFSGPSQARQLCSALLRSALLCVGFLCTALVYSTLYQPTLIGFTLFFGVSARPQRCSLWLKGKVCSQSQTGAGLYVHSRCLIGLSWCQWAKFSQFNWSKRHCPAWSE